MSEASVFDRWDGGVGWMADADEPQQRTSHAIVDDGEVWLVDPVDFDGLDDLLASLGEVAGVVLLLDRHKRDCAGLADRYDVPVTLPGPLGTVAADLDGSTEAVSGTLGDTGYRIMPLHDSRYWREAALFDGETLVVPETVGTSSFFVVRADRLGVHPLLRLFPPRKKLGPLDPVRILVGHGEGVMSEGGQVLQRALDRSRRTAPHLYVKLLRLLATGS